MSKFAHIYLDSMNREQTLTAMYIFALLMLQMFLKSVMPIQAVLILMKLVYIKCISATQNA